MANVDETRVAKWDEVFGDWRKSGKSQRGYCRSEGISYSAFGYWRKKLNGSDRESGFVRVAKAAGVTGAAVRTTVRCSRVDVELTGNETEEFLVRIFRSLEQAACS